MKPPRFSVFGAITLALAPTVTFAADNVFTLGGTISSATSWSAATWSPSTPGTGNAGDVILRSSSAAASPLTLDTAVTIGSIKYTTTSSGVTFGIARSGAIAFTMDGTGMSAANNGFGNAGVASIVNGTAGSSLNIRSNIIIDNTNLDIGFAGASATGTINIGDTAANTTSITNADNTDRNLTFRLNVSSGNVIVNSTIGAAGTAGGGGIGTGLIHISNVGTAGTGTVTLNGNLTAGVGSVVQNSATSRLALAGTNTYDGVYTVTAGSLSFITRSSLFNADTTKWNSSKVAVSTGATLGLGYGGATKFTAAEIASINAGTILSAGTNLGIDVSDTQVYSNAITDANAGASSIGFVKLGAGTLGLSGPSTYTGGTVITEGTLRLDGAQGTTTGPLGASSGGLPTGLIRFNGGTLQFTATNTTDYSSRFSTAAGQTYRIDTGAETVTFASALTSANGVLNKAGTGILILTAENTYGTTGGIYTNVNTGTLRGADTSAYTGNATLKKVFGVGGIQMANNTTLDLRANGQNDSSAQTLTYGNQIQVAASNATYNINVDRESATGGTNKTIVMGTNNVGANAVMNLTGANGYSLQIGNYAPGGGTAASSTLLNPVGANLIIGTIGGGSNSVSPTVGLGGTSTGNTVTGAISNNSTAGATGTAIHKTNTSTWSLNGTNTYSGTTTIDGGTLLINGSTTAASRQITVNSGGTLGGTGNLFGGAGTSLSAGVIVSGGTVSPGNLSTSIGLLRVSSISTTAALSFAAGGTYFWELAAFADNVSGTAGTDFDQIEMSGSGGNLVLGGTSQLTLAFGNAITSPDSADPFWQAARSWTIVKAGASSTNTGSTNFSQLTNGTYAAGTFTTTADALGNVILHFTPVPEPSTALAAALGGLLAFRRRRA